MAISEEMRKRVRKAIRSSYWYGKEGTTERAIHSEEDEDCLVRAIEEIETYRADAEATVADQRAEIDRLTAEYNALANRCSRVVLVTRVVCVDAVENYHTPVGFSFGRCKSFLRPGDLDVDSIFQVVDPEDLDPLTPVPDAPQEDGR